MKIFVGAMALSLMSGTALAAPLINTPSGRPDAIFEGKSSREISDLLVTICLDNGFFVEARTSDAVACVVRRRLSGHDATVVLRAQMTEIGRSTRVQWFIDVEGSASDKRKMLSDDDLIDSLQLSLLEGGGKPPPGSVETRTYLGISIANTAGRVRVMEVSKGLAADRAGLRTGDQITALNGEAIKDTDQFMTKVRTMPPGTTLKLSVLRDGTPSELTVMPGSYLDRDAASSSSDLRDAWRRSMEPPSR